MNDEHCPTIPVKDFLDLILPSEKVLGKMDVGSTIAIYLKGNNYIGKRTISLRTNVDPLSYDHATGLALRCGCLGVLMDWFEINCNWKEGGYVEKDSDSSSDSGNV
jgi:hypothetical protein